MKNQCYNLIAKGMSMKDNRGYYFVSEESPGSAGQCAG